MSHALPKHLIPVFDEIEERVIKEFMKVIHLADGNERILDVFANTALTQAKFRYSEENRTSGDDMNFGRLPKNGD